MSLAFVKAAKTVGAQGLHNTDVNKGVVVPQEDFAVQRDEAGKPVEIVIEELLAQIGREVGLGIVQERSDVVLKSAFAATLIIHEKGIAVTQQDVAGLEVTVKKVVARSAEEEFNEAVEIVFEGLFVEGDAGEAKKIVFEIVQIPGDGLAVEAGDGIADFVIQIAAGFHLESGQHGDNLAVRFDHWGGNDFTSAVFGKEFEKGGVAEVFFKVGTVAEVFSVDLRNGKAVAAKVFGEFEESGVFFGDAVENADGAIL